MYLETLKKSGDFLSITRDNEFHLEPTSFALANGTQVEVLDTGVIKFTPSVKTTKDIVLSSAVHGNETAPIEICDENYGTLHQKLKMLPTMHHEP